MSESFRSTRRIEFRDTDAAGIVHFSAFFYYMESVEHEFLRQLGLSVLGGGRGRPDQLAAGVGKLRLSKRGSLRRHARRGVAHCAAGGEERHL